MSLDAGLRPDEVSNVRESWIDTDNAVLRIPKQESSKNIGSWTVSLTERTATAVERWKDEHQLYDRYTIRHSVGTLMTKEKYLAVTKSQLRHKAPKTTMKYNQVPVEDCRDALDKMG